MVGAVGLLGSTVIQAIVKPLKVNLAQTFKSAQHAVAPFQTPK